MYESQHLQEAGKVHNPIACSTRFCGMKEKVEICVFCFYAYNLCILHTASGPHTTAEFLNQASTFSSHHVNLKQ